MNKIWFVFTLALFAFPTISFAQVNIPDIYNSHDIQNALIEPRLEELRKLKNRAVELENLIGLLQRDVDNSETLEEVEVAGSILVEAEEELEGVNDRIAELEAELAQLRKEAEKRMWEEMFPPCPPAPELAPPDGGSPLPETPEVIEDAIDIWRMIGSPIINPFDKTCKWEIKF